MSVFDDTESSVKAAAHLTPMDQGAVTTLLRLAEKIDRDVDSGKVDNVSIPTYLKFCSDLGLTPAGRLKLNPKKEEAGGKLGQLRAVAGAG